MVSALDELTDILSDESNVSAFELHSSGLVQVLLKLFATAAGGNSYETRAAKKSAKLQRQRVEVFKKCFRDKAVKTEDGLFTCSPSTELVGIQFTFWTWGEFSGTWGHLEPILELHYGHSRRSYLCIFQDFQAIFYILHFATQVRKLVSVLESIEKLPVLLYDQTASAYGLQILTRRLRFKLEKGGMVTGPAAEQNLIDRSGCTLKMEPLANVKQLERFLLKMVAKQWFDHDRNTYTFIKNIMDHRDDTYMTSASRGGEGGTQKEDEVRDVA